MPFVYFPQESGQLATLSPVISEENTIEKIISQVIPAGTPYKIVGDDFRIDSEYFEAYDYCEDNAAKVNIPKAKSIHLDKLRSARAPKLAALDVAFMRAVEQGDSAKQAEIAAEKQALRDVTKLELPDDLPSLKEVWPDILGPRPSA